MHSNNPFCRILFFVLVVSFLHSCSGDQDQYDFTDFAVKDTASIKKFKISDNENNHIVISRNNENQKWLIEGTNHQANKASVDLLMETFYRIRVKQDVPNSAFNTVINRLSVRHKKVELYNGNDKPFKTWYIGSPTQDHQGTYMLLQNEDLKSSKPYITYKPGMYGSLDVRFFTDSIIWRSSKVFHYPNSNVIKKIRVGLNTRPNESYTIERKNNTVYLYDNNNEIVSNYDSSQVRHYLTHYNKINYNKIMLINDNIKDSIFSQTPHTTFELTDINNKIINVEFWNILDNNSETGWDKEYGFIRINKNQELLRVQFFSWEILFKPLSYYKRDIIK